MISAARRCARARPWPPIGLSSWYGRFKRGCAVVAALVIAGVTLLPAPPASAHPTLQDTTPPAGYGVAEAPREVTLDFGEPVGLVPEALRLTSSDGRQVTTAPAALSENGRRLTAGIADELPSGAYRVAWQVRAEDSDLVSGGFSFAVGVDVLDGAGTAAAAGRAGEWAGLNVPAGVLRWVLFAAIALGLGAAAGTLLAGRVRREAEGGGAELARVPAPTLIAAALGLMATSGLIAVGGYGLAELLGSRPGQLLGIELAAFASAFMVAGLARMLGRPGLRTAAAAPLLAVVAAEALRAHVSALQPLAGAVLTAVHLLAAALWIGGLAQVLHAALRWRGEPGWVRLLLFDYAKLAVWLVIAVITTGAVQGLLLVPTVAELLGTGYGRVLLAKLAAVLLVISCAVLAHRRLRRRLGGGIALQGRPGNRQDRPVGHAARIEITTLVSVLALTAALTSLTPPAQAATGAALPPPPIGPAVPVGTLAGQVTVAATASAGRLVLRLTTPLDGPYDEPPKSPPYELTTQIGNKDLALVSCGTGCFTASMDWRPGNTALTVEVNAPPWTGGRTELDIPWPPQPASERLAHVLAAMRAAPPFTLHEAVTSDYRGDPGAAQALPMNGMDFIAREPYAEGAVDPVAVSTADGEQLAFAFPANGIVVRLWLGPDDRIVREVLTSPNHLITRTFDYS